jgi:hypothetical protein
LAKSTEDAGEILQYCAQKYGQKQEYQYAYTVGIIRGIAESIMPNSKKIKHIKEVLDALRQMSQSTN